MIFGRAWTAAAVISAVFGLANLALLKVEQAKTEKLEAALAACELAGDVADGVSDAVQDVDRLSPDDIDRWLRERAGQD